MKRLFSLGLLILFSLSASAIEMTFAPRSPAVFRADAQTPDGVAVKGPWFSNQVFFNSEIETVIHELDVHVTAPTGATIDYKMILPEPLALHPGITAHTGVLYFGALPFSRVLNYRVDVRASGDQGVDLYATFFTE